MPKCNVCIGYESIHGGMRARVCIRVYDVQEENSPVETRNRGEMRNYTRKELKCLKRAKKGLKIDSRE